MSYAGASLFVTQEFVCFPILDPVLVFSPFTDRALKDGAATENKNDGSIVCWRTVIVGAK